MFFRSLIECAVDSLWFMDALYFIQPSKMSTSPNRSSGLSIDVGYQKSIHRAEKQHARIHAILKMAQIYYFVSMGVITVAIYIPAAVSNRGLPKTCMSFHGSDFQ